MAFILYSLSHECFSEKSVQPGAGSAFPQLAGLNSSALAKGAGKQRRQLRNHKLSAPHWQDRNMQPRLTSPIFFFFFLFVIVDTPGGTRWIFWVVSLWSQANGSVLWDPSLSISDRQLCFAIWLQLCWQSQRFLRETKELKWASL